MLTYKREIYILCIVYDNEKMSYENCRHLSKHSGLEAPEESRRQNRERLDPAASEPRGCDLEQNRCYVLCTVQAQATALLTVSW